MNNMNNMNNNNNMQLMLTAINFAAEKHKNQRRKDKEKSPYINHCIDVAHLLSIANTVENNNNNNIYNENNIIIGGLLHDTLEDTDTTVEELELIFGKEITKLVIECTDNKKLTKIERKKHQILSVNYISNETKLIKLADKYSNLKSLSLNPPVHWSTAVINGYIYWSYAVIKLYLNMNKYFYNLFNIEFKKYNLDINNITDEELNKQLDIYYNLIKDSE